jgi:4-hydroxy-tetrahydrodipicolinate reductase
MQNTTMKIALYGYGKMGQAIEKAATLRGHSIVLKVDHDNAGTPPTGADVAIEFSRPENALPNMRLCLEAWCARSLWAPPVGTMSLVL